MSTLDYAGDRYSAGGAAVQSGPPTDEPGMYLTDEVFLYRVVGLVATEAGGDGRTRGLPRLDVVHVPVSDVSTRCFRVVTAAPADS